MGMTNGNLNVEDQAMNRDDQQTEEKKTFSQWLWKSWIALALLAVVSFSVCNIFIGRLSDLGIKSVNYFNSGSLLFSILYFLVTKEYS